MFETNIQNLRNWFVPVCSCSIFKPGGRVEQHPGFQHPILMWQFPDGDGEVGNV